MGLVVAITGTRQTEHHELSWYAEIFDRYLGPWATPDTRWYIGGARGVDSLSLLWLAGNSRSGITVVVPGTVAQQPADARQAMEQCRDRIDEIVELGAAELRTPAYHARNRWMVDRSGVIAGFPLAGPEGVSGTWQTINYAAGQGKPRLIVPV